MCLDVNNLIGTAVIARDGIGLGRWVGGSMGNWVGFQTGMGSVGPWLGRVGGSMGWVDG